MWNLIVQTPNHEPIQTFLKEGKLTLGRASTNNIVLEDTSASRQHAEIVTDESGAISVVDLNSTNGTYVNRQRISGSHPLSANDIVRIGQIVIQVMEQGAKSGVRPSAKGTHLFTRELLLESLDQHSILLYEVSRKLNLATDIGTVINELITLIKQTMGVQVCEVILKEIFSTLEEPGKETLAMSAIKNRSAEVTATEMYVPILSGQETLALLYLKKERPGTRPFDDRDLQIAIAISHQAGLTLQRMNLMDQVRKEEQARQLLMRFVSPTEIKFLLKDYLASGLLPPLTEQKVTVLFADLADSTGMAEKMGVRRFAGILSQLYADSAEIIFKYHGVLRYEGDGVMAIYMDIPDAPTPEERAVLSGRELLGRIKTTGRLEAGQRIVMGVTINTGVAMVGYIGTSEQAEFNALGDVVNAVYRMQPYARPNRIVAGPATIAAIVNKYRTQRIGAVTLRGRENSMQVYEILP